MWCCVVSEHRYGETQAYMDSEVMHWNCLMLLKCRTFHLLWGWCHILMKCFQKHFELNLLRCPYFCDFLFFTLKLLPHFSSHIVEISVEVVCRQGDFCRASWVYWRLSAFRTNTRVVSLQDQCCFQRFEKEITYLTCKSSSNASHFY